MIGAVPESFGQRWSIRRLPIRLPYSNRWPRVISCAFLVVGIFALGWSARWAISLVAPPEMNLWVAVVVLIYASTNFFGWPATVAIVMAIGSLLCGIGWLIVRGVVRPDGYVEITEESLTINNGRVVETFLFSKCSRFDLHRFMGIDDPSAIIWSSGKTHPIFDVMFTILGALVGVFAPRATFTNLLHALNVPGPEGHLEELCNILNRLQRAAQPAAAAQ
jgi:hypothetical protein